MSSSGIAVSKTPAMRSLQQSGSYKTYIKGPHFRGYLHSREDASLKFTRFEKARIIGARALQISLGAPILVEVPEAMIDPIDISLVEYEKKVIPMTVKRET